MPLTIQDFDDALEDLKTIGDVTNLTQDTKLSSRLGALISTLFKAIGDIGFLPNAIPWTPTTLFDNPQQLVTEGSDTYRLKEAHTSGATFAEDASKWTLFTSDPSIPTVTDLDNAVDGFFRFDGTAANVPPIGVTGGGYQITSSQGNIKTQYVQSAGSFLYVRSFNGVVWTVWVRQVDENDLKFLTISGNNFDTFDAQGNFAIQLPTSTTLPPNFETNIAVQDHATIEVIRGQTVTEASGVVAKRSLTIQRLHGIDTLGEKTTWSRYQDETDVSPSFGDWIQPSGGGSGDAVIITDLDNAPDGFIKWGNTIANAPAGAAHTGSGYQTTALTAGGSNWSRSQEITVAKVRYTRTEDEAVGWLEWHRSAYVGIYGIGFSAQQTTNIDDIDASSGAFWVDETVVSGTYPPDAVGDIRILLEHVQGSILDINGLKDDKSMTTQTLTSGVNANDIRQYKRYRNETQVSPSWSDWHEGIDRGDFGYAGAAPEAPNFGDADDIDTTGSYFASQNCPTAHQYLIRAVNKTVTAGNTSKHQIASRADGFDFKLFHRGYDTNGNFWNAWVDLTETGGGGGFTPAIGYMSKDNLTLKLMPTITATVFQKIEDSVSATVYDDSTGSTGVTVDLINSTLEITAAGTYNLKIDVEISIDAPLSDITVSIAKFTGVEPAIPVALASRLVRSTTADNSNQRYHVEVSGTEVLAIGDKLIPIVTSNATTNPSIKSTSFSAIRIA